MAVARSYREGWLTSQKIDALRDDSAELFLFRLGLKADKNGVYFGEAELLRAAVFPLQVSRRRLADVTRFRDKCAKAGLLRLWTAADGRPYVQILNFRQKTLNEKPLHPLPPGEPDDTGQQQLGIAEPEPPPRASRMKEKRKEESGEARGARDTRHAELCLDEISQQWPSHDLPACLRRAQAYVRRQRGTEAVVTVHWFVTHWLPGEAAPAVVGGRAIEPEPEAWRQYLKDRYTDEGWAASAAMFTWSEMPPQWRAKIAKEMVR